MNFGGIYGESVFESPRRTTRSVGTLEVRNVCFTMFRNNRFQSPSPWTVAMYEVAGKIRRDGDMNARARRPSGDVSREMLLLRRVNDCAPSMLNQSSWRFYFYIFITSDVVNYDFDFGTVPRRSRGRFTRRRGEILLFRSR